MYGVQRAEKYKRQDILGIEKEATRTADHYNNDVDVNRTQDNVSIINCCDWMQKINDTIANTNVRVRKDSIVAIGGLYTATGDFFSKKPNETTQQQQQRMLKYFRDCLQWHCKTYCQGNADLILSATIHLDETTPHMQIYSIPIMDRGDNKYSLSAKTIMGNREAYRNRVDSFYNDVSKKYGLERGEETPDGQKAKKHIETQRHKLNQLKRDLAKTEADKENANFDVVELQCNVRQLAKKKQAEQQQVVALQAQSDDLQKQISDLQGQIDSMQQRLQAGQQQIKKQDSIIADNTKQINKQQHNLDQYNDLMTTLADLQDWLSYDTYWQSAVSQFPAAYRNCMPRGFEADHMAYYYDNVAPFAEYVDNQMEQINQCIDDLDMDL